MANGSCRTNFFARKNYEKKQTNSKLKYAPHIIQDELFSQANFSNNLVRVSCDNFHYWFGKCESEPNALAIIFHAHYHVRFWLSPNEETDFWSC
jgi:hypothetical protein